MDKLDSLLRQSAEDTKAPPRFTEGVMGRIDALESLKDRRDLIRSAVLLGAVSLLFFYALSSFIVDLFTLQTIDFVSIALLDPGILGLENGMTALAESIPVMSLLLTVLSFAVLMHFLRSLYKATDHLSVSLLHSHHAV